MLIKIALELEICLKKDTLTKDQTSTMFLSGLFHWNLLGLFSLKKGTSLLLSGD